MQLDGEPDCVRVSPSAVPWVGELPIPNDADDRIVRVARGGRDLTVEGRLVTLAEDLDAAEAVDLRVNLEEGVLVVEHRVRLAGRPPEIQSDIVTVDEVDVVAGVGEFVGVQRDLADDVVTRDVERRVAR